MSKVVIVRHGITEWSDRFTGWTDIDLLPEGTEAVRTYAEVLKKEGFSFDVGYTSYLKRAIKTIFAVLDVMDLLWIPVVKSWKLNERHYGALQGLNKAETVEKYGNDMVAQWRRGYTTAPPPLELQDPRHPSRDIKYAHIPRQDLPSSESLQDTYNRTIPYWKSEIEPLLTQEKQILLSAHHNSLRSIVKYLDNLSDQEIVNVNIPYCIPLVYEFDATAKPTKHYYLAPDTEVQRVIESIKNQTKK